MVSSFEDCQAMGVYHEMIRKDCREAVVAYFKFLSLSSGRPEENCETSQ